MHRSSTVFEFEVFGSRLWLSALVFSSSLLTGQSTFPIDEGYAWSGNAGWSSFSGDQKTGVIATDFFLSGFAWEANTGWIDFGSGTPRNGYRYSNTSDDHGVNHDGAGGLSGYAYSANTGWIHFGWASATDANRPQIDLITGALSGFAYSANLGWINLGIGQLRTVSLQVIDTDQDGISDPWEYRHFEDLVTATATSDADGDGRSDRHEYLADTDPRSVDDFFRILEHRYDEAFTMATLRFTSSSSRLYRIEYGDDLGLMSPWTDSQLGIFLSDLGRSTTRTIGFSSGKEAQFFRVLALRPLPP